MCAWSVVVPVKRLAVAKTRLRPALPGVEHDRLVLAMCRDTVTAALRCSAVGRVVAVTDDPLAGPALLAAGAHVIADEPGAGLNPALEHGAAAATRLAPADPVAVISADLPALRPADLAAALTAATGHRRAFVRDVGGTGTTLLAALAGEPLGAAYGPDSGRAHAASGAVELEGEWPSLRRDVDTAADLAAAAELGLGPHTTAVLGNVARMQATVRSYDPQTRSGSVLLDNGTPVEFGPAAFDAGGLRLLRIGQRVRLDRAPEGTVTRITLSTLP